VVDHISWGVHVVSETTKSRLLFLLIIPVFLYVSSLHIMPLLDPDETRYSEISDIMVDTGDYVTPRLNHVVYLEKPPLAYWATAAMFKLFGEHEFSARLFTGLCAWGCILLAFSMGSFLHDEKTGLYSAGVLSTFLYIFILGHINLLDMPLAFFVCLATWAGYRYMTGDRPLKGWLYLLYTASALAFLTKGLIGVVFPFAILILWLLIAKRGRDILRLFSPVGLIILIAIVSPWLILVQKANKDFLWFFFVHEHFLRYTTKIHERYHSVLYYLPVVILGILPWAAFLIQGIRASSANENKMYLNRIEKRFLITWIIFIFAFFSVSSSKLIPYIAPIFVPIAVIFGHLFKQYDDQAWQPLTKPADRFLHHLPVILQSLLFIAVLLLPVFIENHTKFGGDLVIVHSHDWIWLILLPIAFQLLLIFVPEMMKRRFGGGWFLTAYFLSVLFLVSLIYPTSAFLTPYKSAYPLTQAIKAHLPANHDLYQYKIFLYGIECYTDIRTHVVENFGEMEFGMNQLSADEKSRYFLSEQEFFQLCKGKRVPVYCVTANKKNFDELNKTFPRLHVIWSNGVYYFIRLVG
jgi:4-amino-4-deoxy-L-arabinose transferase-like glycosyltransferase